MANKRISHPDHPTTTALKPGYFIAVDPTAGPTEKYDVSRLSSQRNASARRGAIHFDGTTGYASRDLGAAGTLGADAPLTVSVVVEGANVAGDRGILGLSDTAGNVARAGAIALFASSTGALVARLYGASTADYRELQVANWKTLYAGRIVAVVWVVRLGLLYIDGALATTTTNTAGSSPPAWSAALTGTIVTVGRQTSTAQYLGRISDVCLYRAALTAGDVIECFDLGGGVPERFKWVSDLPELVVNGDFASAAGWTLDAGWAIGSGVLTATNVAVNAAAYRSDLPLVAGKAYEVTYSVSGYSAGQVRAELTDSSSSGPSRAAGTYRNANGTYTEIITALSTGTGRVVFVNRAGGGNSFSIDNVSIERLGAVACWPLNDGGGFQPLDESSNGLNLALTTSGAAHVHAAPIGTRRAIVGSYLAAGISTLPGTTLAGTLPPGWAVVDDQVEVGTAADAGRSLNLGTSGTPTRYVSALAIDTLGLKSGVVLSTVPNSRTANTNLYWQKSGSTTTGELISTVIIIERKY